MEKTVKKVVVIGSGPIVIGQAAEFDYAGTQACRSLREEGVQVVLINSNPATIMTDPAVADSVYIEPLTVGVLERIISIERPDGILGTLGGQTGLNLLMELEKEGILKKYNVRPLGTSISSIETAEDREKFRNLLHDIGEPAPSSVSVNALPDAVKAAEHIGYPVVIRPAFTLGGTGGGFARNRDELEAVVSGGLALSPVSQVLVEKSLRGWKEVEYEVMRDSAGNVITVCNMENIDPMGVHTGDSIVVAPSQTLSDKDYQRLRTASLNIIKALKIEGGCNVQFALRPSPEVIVTPETVPEYYVIEVNPRVSRSSALASKSTGYPIARVAAKIALGLTLDQIPNAVTRTTTAAFEPVLDYCVVKIPCWPFAKFPEADRSLGTQMKATGEVMAIDRTFEAALQKAVRSLEGSKTSLIWENPAWEEIPQTEPVQGVLFERMINTKLDLDADDERLWKLAASIRRGESAQEVARRSKVDPWFIYAIQRIVEMQRRLQQEPLSPELLRSAKRMGFPDADIANLSERMASSTQVRQMRIKNGITPVYKMVDTCAAEFEAITPYFYSSYEEENEALALEGDKAIVLGSGPIRIGQGIEFDYCSVHASLALRKSGSKSIMVNSNPETVSTDFDESDRLYFEPLDEESILDIVDNETFNGVRPYVLPQFGGQTAIDLSQKLGIAGVPILGSSDDVIDKASDRGRFEEIATKAGLPLPPGGMARTFEQSEEIANNIGYPVLVRPSYVLGGRAMEIVQNRRELEQYFRRALDTAPGQSILVDRYLSGIEVEVDAVSDGKEVLIPGVMQHIERAGVHSGDSMSVYPAVGLSDSEVRTIESYTKRIASALGIVGLLNIQFVVTTIGTGRGFSKQDRPENILPQVYILEVNPRSSRTVPFISKVTGIPLIDIAVRAMRGTSIREQGLTVGLAEISGTVAVKAPVFSMSKITGADTFLGPEMKSTGEVMGTDVKFEPAVEKALLASGLTIPLNVPVLLSIADPDKDDALPLVKKLHSNGHRLYATPGTAGMIRSIGIEVDEVAPRLSSGKFPTVVDLVSRGDVGVVVNTVTGDRDTLRDGFYIRRVATEKRIPCFTSIDTAIVAAEAEARASSYNIKPLDQYLKKINKQGHS